MIALINGPHGEDAVETYTALRRLAEKPTARWPGKSTLLHNGVSRSLYSIATGPVEAWFTCGVARQDELWVLASGVRPTDIHAVACTRIGRVP
jgi:hypothetical protein